MALDDDGLVHQQERVSEIGSQGKVRKETSERRRMSELKRGDTPCTNQRVHEREPRTITLNTFGGPVFVKRRF